MNVKELIEKYEYLNHNYFRRVDTSEILKDLRQLDEPEKVKIPQFVADWYEEHKDNFDYNLWEYLVDWDRQNPSDFKEWIAEGDKYEPLITLVNMHQFGYEVEKEPKYLVKLKGVLSNFMVLKHNINEDTWYMSNKINYTDLKAYHTKKQLEQAGFGEVFNSPLFEIEEVVE